MLLICVLYELRVQGLDSNNRLIIMSWYCKLETVSVLMLQFVLKRP